MRDIEFDPVTGSATVIPRETPRSDSAAPAGFAHFERHVFGTRQAFALYRSRDALYFNAGARRWSLDQAGLQFVHRPLFVGVSRFGVLEGGREVFAMPYCHPGRQLLSIIDPTHDALDMESDYFLGFVADNALSPVWQAQVRERWIPDA